MCRSSLKPKDEENTEKRKTQAITHYAAFTDNCSVIYILYIICIVYDHSPSQVLADVIFIIINLQQVKQEKRTGKFTLSYFCCHE